MKNMTNIIAGTHLWRKKMASNIAAATGQDCIYISKPEELSITSISTVNPQYVFFTHWSNIIPQEVFESYECIVFHMTDLPFGRGGSPLQNLISRGIYETKISALRCVKSLDAGPVYMKRPLSLYGTAQEIYMRANVIIEEMIISIIKDNPKPIEQSGEPVIFKRRNELDGDIAQLKTLEEVHDFIRMLDADGYPRAFLEINNLRLEFSRSSIKSDHLFADVIIREITHEK